ncbi:N-acetylglucosamine kinase [Alicyclobacillus acidiphilus]|uniref:N-acetylglucosamine kinase n=1 Tax=Alicyclobacillus acidiphilus TaxID=182455 RepID=UPI000A63BD40|nr:BadF/BadG/BcrA/BcrD ATPase family protein [Alicyclobacillus acidiphilus]
MAIFIGIDGGGTKTNALFFDTVTKQSLALEGAASRTSSVGWQASLEVIQDLIRRGLRQIGAEADEIGGISACMSGIDLPHQSARMANELAGQIPVQSIEVVNDALAVLSAGTRGEPGVVVIGGTGSIALAEDSFGNVARAGGYGSLIGDEGSGYDIGRRGLMAAVQFMEGRGEKTILWDKAAETYDIQHPSELISIIYEAEYPIAKIASFAPRVIEAAVSDPVADAIVSDAVGSYQGLIASVSGQLQGNAGDVVILSGGLFTHDGWLVDRLSALCPAYQFRPLRHKPVYGALLRALRLGQEKSYLQLADDALATQAELTLDDLDSVV